MADNGHTVQHADGEGDMSTVKLAMGQNVQTTDADGIFTSEMPAAGTSDLSEIPLGGHTYTVKVPPDKTSQENTITSEWKTDIEENTFVSKITTGEDLYSSATLSETQTIGSTVKRTDEDSGIDNKGIAFTDMCQNTPKFLPTIIYTSVFRKFFTLS